MADYSLTLYQPVLIGSAQIASLTGMAQDWRRSIRLQGGYWLGSFVVKGQPKSLLTDFFYTQLGAHLEERSGGFKTWEGFVYEMDLAGTNPPELRVTVAGYAFTINWRYVSVGDDTDANASTWINSILATDCPFIAARSISTNTLQVRQAVDIDQRCFDEIMRVTDMGASGGALWRFYVDNGRRAVYEAVSTAPRYYSAGGFIHRRSLDTTWNYVSAVYTNTSDVVTESAAASQANSIAQFGRKEQKLVENNVPQAAMENLRDTYLKYHAWPYPVAVGSIPGIQLYTGAGQNLGATNPWSVKPAVVRDMLYPLGRVQAGSPYATHQDFLVDEVTVSATRDPQTDERGGEVSLKALEFGEEVDALQTQYQVQAADGTAGDGKARWARRLGLDREAWLALSAEEKQQRKKEWRSRQ